jgi:hypothetical protein
VEAPGDTIYPNVTGAFSFFACARLCPLVRRQIIAYACDGNCSKQERDYGRVQRKPAGSTANTSSSIKLIGVNPAASSSHNEGVQHPVGAIWNICGNARARSDPVAVALDL